MLMGAYRPGSDPQFDRALAMKPALDRYLQQSPDQLVSLEASVAELAQALTDGG